MQNSMKTEKVKKQIKFFYIVIIPLFNEIIKNIL